jgi:transcriptional regulator with XRE-family HTH domain
MRREIGTSVDRQTELPGTKASTAVDLHVGQQLRARRKTLGLSQELLATRVGVTFQQMQKYEKGTNRISASRLFDIAQALSVPVSYFFEGLTTHDTDPDDVIAVNSDEIALLTAFRAARQETRNHLIALAEASGEQPTASPAQRKWSSKGA